MKVINKNLENASLPFLRILKTYGVPSQSLTGLIKSTKGHLTEIIIINRCYNDNGHGCVIQAIYQNCPNLKYLKLSLRNSGIPELEKLLINCQYLNGLVISKVDRETEWNGIFKILTKSSPVGLFKFKFYSLSLEWDSLKLFLDNWKDRHPMLLITYQDMSYEIEKYIVKGTVKKYDYLNLHWCDFEDFEWIQKNQ